MTTGKILQVLSIIACAALMVAPAFAADVDVVGHGHGVCTLDGAWFGTTPFWGLSWPIVYQSTSHWTGTMSMQMIGGDPTLGGFFPVTSLSSTTGTWVRTGRRTFEYTMIHYGLAEGGQDPLQSVQPVFLAKLSGSMVVTGDCDQLEVTNVSLSLYDPTQDPFGDDPPTYGCVADGSASTAQRIPVQPPCEP
jgi:hypothetical protein